MLTTPELASHREQQFKNIKNMIKTMDILKDQLDMWKKTLNFYLKKNENIFLLGTMMKIEKNGSLLPTCFMTF